MSKKKKLTHIAKHLASSGKPNTSLWLKEKNQCVCYEAVSVIKDYNLCRHFQHKETELSMLLLASMKNRQLVKELKKQCLLELIKQELKERNCLVHLIAS